MAVHQQNLSAARSFVVPHGEWSLERLNHITVVFGRNGTGKSQLLRAIRDANRQQRHDASPERGGEIAFNAGYMAEEFDAGTRGSRRTTNVATVFRDEAVARIQAFLNKRGNVRTGEAPVNPARLEELMNVLLPGFSFAILGGTQATDLSRANGEKVANVGQLSSGEAALYGLGLDLLGICALWMLDGQREGILLIDEPDLHLHPDLQQHFANFVVRLVDQFEVQVLVATHSTTLLAALGHHGGARTSVIYLDPASAAQVARPFTEAAQQLANVLGGHALMGPLFAVPLLLVEGDDDYRAWAHATRFNILKVAVLPCGGAAIREYEATLVKIFRALIEKPTRPLAFAIHDLDEHKEQPAAAAGYVVRLWLNCRELENLYLSSEVLTSMNTDADTVRTRLADQASQFGQKEGALRAVAASDDWQHMDLKGLMEELARAVDSKYVDWRLRIGAAIGPGKPSGELAEWLGESVIEALWP